MNNINRVRFALLALLAVYCFANVPLYSSTTGTEKNLLEMVDLVENWNFTETEYGGWDGDNHTNIVKPTHWKFAGDNDSSNEQYRVINDTANGGDTDTLFAQPTRTNHKESVMFWQDFTATDINSVTIQHHSKAGKRALILLYGLNSSVSEDTALPAGSTSYIAYIDPITDPENPEYWSTYTNYTVNLFNLTNTYHHYRIHWEITEWPGTPPAALYVSYCRVTESTTPPTTPTTTIPPLHEIPGFLQGLIIIGIIGVALTVGLVLFDLKREGKI